MSSILPYLARALVPAAAGAYQGQMQGQADARQRQRQSTADLLQQAAFQSQQAAADQQQKLQRASAMLSGIHLGETAPDAYTKPINLGDSGALPGRAQSFDGGWIDTTQTPEARSAQREQDLERRQAAALQQKAAMEEQQRQQRSKSVADFLKAYDPQKYGRIDPAAFGAMDPAVLADIAKNATAAPKGWQPQSKAEYMEVHPPFQSQLSVGPDGQVIDLRAKKAEADLAKQFGHEVPIQTASKYAGNAANTLEAVNAARHGDRSAHFGAIYGYIQQAHPGIAVKRGDKGILVESQGLPADIQMKIARWTGQGGLLTPQALNEIEQGTHAMAAAQQSLTAPVMAQYGRMARQRGADSSNVARDPLSGIGGGGQPTPQQAAWDQAAAYAKQNNLDVSRLGPRP